MNSELMSCPTCSHTVSNPAGACTYCGAMMVKEERLPQNEIKDIGATAAMPDSPPPLPNAQSGPANPMSDPNTGNAGPTASQPAAASPTTAVTSDPAPGVEAESEIELLYFEDEAESPASAEKQGSESTPETGDVIPVADPKAEAAGPESVADAGAIAEIQPNAQETETAAIANIDNNPPIAEQGTAAAITADSGPSSPEPDTTIAASDQPADPKMAVEKKVAQTAVVAAQPALGTQPAATDKPPAAEIIADTAAIKPEKDLPPKNASVVNVESEAASVSTGETILLDLATEVEPAAGEPSAASAVAETSKAKAASPTNSIPQTDAAKAMALKQQKAAQAKAQALKKQKILRAKAIALQRKKEAQAKAQAASAAAKNDKGAAAPASAKPAASPGTALRMHTLLEKYKGRVIGINYDNSAEIKGAQLVQVNAEFFSVFVKEKGLRYSYPISAILTVMESKDGVDIDNAKQVDKFLAVFKLYPLVLF